MYPATPTDQIDQALHPIEEPAEDGVVLTRFSLLAGSASLRDRTLDGDDTDLMVKWSMAESPSIAIVIEGRPHLAPPLLKELYDITRRSSVELSTAILAGDDVYAASLFGNDHVEVAPRLERTAAFCARNDLAFRIEETYDGETEQIDLATLRSILEATDGQF